ncbi:hypothetical protein ACHAPU_011058 [Fusarium lateritium]
MGALEPIQRESVVKDPVKRRGRPRKQSSSEDETVMIRRARGRQAQYVYRMRQEAAQKDQNSRLRQLEDAVEGMSSSVEIFAKNILSLSVVKQHHEILTPLREMTARVLALAEEVNNCSAYAPKTVLPDDMTENNRDSLPARVGRESESHSTASSSPPSSQAQEVKGADPSTNDVTHNDIWSNTTEPPSQDYSQGIGMDHWLLGAKGTVAGSNHRLPHDSLAYKLVYSSLSTALSALTEPHHVNTSMSEEYRIFGSILHAPRRSYLRGMLQWLFGPGATYFYDCAKLSFFSDCLSDPGQQHPTSSRLAETKQLSFLSVMDVETKLLGLGARMQDQEVIELQIEDPNVPRQTLDEQCLSHLAVGDFALFPTDQSVAAKMTVHLSMPLLINHLSKSAICLGRGPVFPVHDLDFAIEASIVAAHG